MLPDYLHSAEADHFAFIRVPKILLQNEAFQGISVEAKLLYSLLFDRTELSNKNGWRDDQDRVYIIFTVAEIQENLNCGNKKAIQLLDELENKAGLIEAYKTKAPQEKSAQPRESAREKLDALVKDTAAKVSIEKPKAKTKSKKGPEL